MHNTETISKNYTNYLMITAMATNSTQFATQLQVDEVQFQIYMVIGVFTGLIVTLFILVFGLCVMTRRHFVTNKKLPLQPPVDKFFEYKQQQSVSGSTTAGSSVCSENFSSSTNYQNGRKRPPPIRLNSLTNGHRSPFSPTNIYNDQTHSSFSY